MSVRAAGVGCLLIACLGSPLVPLAQETRTLPPADRVPLHSVVDVGTLPAPTPQDASDGRITSKPRRLRTDKTPREAIVPAPPPADVTPPPVAASRLSTVSAFEGLGNSDNSSLTGFSAVPSDANLAVGSSHVFEMVNIVGRISTKSGATLSTFSLRSFFQLDPSADESDASLLYDAPSGRWFAVYLMSSSTQSSLVLAVSTSGDPTGTFCRFRLGNLTSETFLQDFPQLGISDDKVVLTYNGFNLTGTMFLGAGYYAINKADLVSGPGCPSSVRRVRVPPDVTRYGVQPSRALSSTGTLWMATNDGPIPGGNRVIVIGVNGLPGVGPVTEDTFNVTTRSWAAPPDAEQQGSSTKLTTNDESVITAVWQRGTLWVGGNEGCVPDGDGATRSCLRLIQIATDSRGLQQDITFGAPSRHYYYPAASLDGAGNLFVVFNASSSTEFAGVRATGRLTTDAPNTLVAPALLRPGGGAQASSRMGDFYGAAQDPADPSKVWVAAEYIKSSSGSNWGTIIAQLTFGPPPTVALSLNGHTFTTGNTLRVDLTVTNPAAATFVDIYLGALLPPSAGPGFGCPMSDAVAFVSGGAVAIRCLSASPATFPKFSAASSIAAGVSMLGNFFSFVWPSTPPAGAYTAFVAFAVPGSLDDGGFGPTDVIAIGSDTLSFSP